MELSYSPESPLEMPVVVNLPDNGIRLRFDGPDQRLRLIEIVDFHRTIFTYKTEPFIQNLESALHSPNRMRSSLMYRRVYQLFGPSYPGEFLPSGDNSAMGTYVLSYPGIAFSFPVQTSAWSPKVDHAAMLSSSAAPVTSVAIFEGGSWPEARNDLFTRQPANPRSSHVAIGARKENGAVDEIDHVRIHGMGQIEMLRRSAVPFWLILSQTTPQDLITELGAPDQIFRRPSQEGTPPQLPSDGAVKNRRMSSIPNSYGSARSTPSSVSSTNTDTYATTDFEDDDDDEATIHGGEPEGPIEERYYCYFSHGFDILLGPPTDISPFPGAKPDADDQPSTPKPDSHVVATRIILHGNVPGSYPFNRHRRSRWSLASPPYPPPRKSSPATTEITSESRFPDFHKSLINSFADFWPEKDMSEGMVIVRNWNGDGYDDGDTDSPSGSAIWIGGEMDEDIITSSTAAKARRGKAMNANMLDTDSEMDDEVGDDWEGIDGIGDAPPRRGKGEDKWLRNTKLFKFPGLMFEVMWNGAVSALTVY